MHDEGVGFEALGAGFGEAEERCVFAEGREVFLALTLVLDAEEIGDEGVALGLLDDALARIDENDGEVGR